MGNYVILGISTNFRVLVDTSFHVNLPEAIQKQVDLIWSQEKEQNPHLFNGRLLSLLSHDDQCLTGAFVEYKYYLAQLRQPDLFNSLKITPVCVSAITHMGSNVLVGKRSTTVIQYPTFYELVPSGGVDGEAAIGEEVDIPGLTLRELEEEAGIKKSMVTRVTAIGLIVDEQDNNIEICMEIELIENGELTLLPCSHEHTELKWVAKTDLLSISQQSQKNWVPLSLHLIKRYFSR